MDNTSMKQMPAFGRRSKPTSTSNSHHTTPRHHSHTTDEPVAYPDKTDSARGSLRVKAVGESGGKYESILSFIAAQEDEVGQELAEDGIRTATPSTTTRSASPSHAPARPAGLSTSASSPASSFSSHHRSMSATASYARSSPPIHPFSSTTSPATSSSPLSSASNSSTSASSPFEAYKAKLTALTNTVTTLESTITALQHSHTQSLEQQQHTHIAALASLQKQHEARLTEQLSFIEQLVTSKQQLTTDLDTLTLRTKQHEEQLMARHVELELAAEDKLKQRLETAKSEWRDKELRLVKANVTKAMEREVERLMAKQAMDVKAVDEQWQQKLSVIREDAERQWQTREVDVRRQCAEDGRREREREERRRDDLVRQLTLDFTTKQTELSRQHEQERRSDRQRWDEKQHTDQLARHKADTDRDERLNSEWQQRLTTQQESCEADKQRHEAECEHKLQRAIQQAEERLRATVRTEGEAELAHVIERLGEETVQLSKDERAKHKHAIDQLTQQHTVDRQQWAAKHSQCTQQMQRQSEQLVAQQKQWEKRSDEWAERWKEAEEWKRQLEQLRAEQQQATVVQQHSRQHDTDALTAVQQQLKRSTERWQRERQQLLDDHRDDKSSWQQRHTDNHNRDMQEVERRVKDTIRKKDEVIDGLQTEMRRLQGQIVAMSDTIELQKHELLSLG